MKSEIGIFAFLLLDSLNMYVKWIENCFQATHYQEKSRPAFICKLAFDPQVFFFFCFSFIKPFLILSVLAREHFLWDRREEENPLVNIISTEQPVFTDHDKKANRVLCHHPSINFYVSSFNNSNRHSRQADAS